MEQQAAGAAGQQDKDAAFSSFPAPPGFYRLYKDGPGAGPPPPAPVRGELHALGEPFNTEEALVPPLDVPTLFTVQPDGSVDVKAELLKLNQGLLFLFLELLAVLVQQPSAYAALLSQILVTLHNMVHLVNLVRPHQARETLKCALQAQIQEKRAALGELRSKVADIKARALDLTRALAAAGSDAAESVPAQRPPADAGAAPMDEG